MKVFLIVEDDPNAPGGITVNVMPQLTIAELGSVDPFGTLAGQYALEARDHIDNIRVSAVKLATEIKHRYGMSNTE